MTNHEKIKLAFGGLKAPDGMADEIIANREGHKTPRRLRPVRRIILVAAVLLMMTATALAVSPELREAIFGLPSFNPAADEWGNHNIESAVYAHPISDNLRTYMETREGTLGPGYFRGAVIELPDGFWDGRTYEEAYEEAEEKGWLIYTRNTAMSSLDEVDDLFGVRLLRNPLLGTYGTGRSLAVDDPAPHVWVCADAESNTVLADLQAYFVLDGETTVGYWAGFVFDDHMTGPIDRDLASIGYDFDERQLENYDGRPSGVKALIMNGGFARHAFFIVDGIAYRLDVYCHSDVSDPTAILKEIIDAFE